jgi:NhaP-type Na+/H+ or K+/H+ antiporter
MFLFAYFGVSINVSVRNKMKKAVPYLLTVMGMLLILRGLGLGIPYIKPRFTRSYFSKNCHLPLNFVDASHC